MLAVHELLNFAATANVLGEDICRIVRSGQSGDRGLYTVPGLGHAHRRVCVEISYRLCQSDSEASWYYARLAQSSLARQNAPEPGGPTRWAVERPHATGHGPRASIVCGTSPPQHPTADSSYLAVLLNNSL